MNTAIWITLIICSTILLIVLFALLLNQKQINQPARHESEINDRHKDAPWQKGS